VAAAVVSRAALQLLLNQQQQGFKKNIYFLKNAHAGQY
jgi:hypothetical protein